MIPSRLLILSLAGCGVLGVAAGWLPEFETYWLAAIGGLGFFSLIDMGLALGEKGLSADREVPGSLPVGISGQVKNRFSNDGRRAVELLAYDHHPASFEVSRLPVKVKVKPKERCELTYIATPTERGEHAFGLIDTRMLSPLGLWWRLGRFGRQEIVRVYPNFAAVSKYITLATDHRLSDIGVRKLRRRGTGSEFHQLREYRQGDSLRQVDWRASARVRKLISREYQDERDQSVIFLLDCGRRMRAKDGELSHFDEALNAVLLLAYVALRQGDGVGVSTFGGVDRWLPPIKGKPMLNKLLNVLYDLQPGTELPDYAHAAQQLLVRHRKHSLVVVVTSLRDEDSDDLLPALDILRRRHLVLLAGLREQVLDSTMAADVRSFEDALRLTAIHHYMIHREQALKTLRNSGALCLDVNPKGLSLELVNAYLAIKAQGAL